jgi:uncharacterized membrane protein HdeD (DUF308 family)
MQPARTTLMAQILTTPWWLQLLRGLLALAFGLYAINQPALTLVVMVQFMGAFLFVEGVVLFFYALTDRTGHTKRSFVALRGLFYVLAGVAVLAMPILATIVTAAMLGWFVGFLAIFGGVVEISTGLRAERDHPSDWSMVLLGVLSLVFGVLLLSAPMAYGVGMSFLFGVWSVVAGVFLIANSFRIRAGKKKLEQLAHKAL